ncbi:MAG: TonB-dependent receptor, partial [Pedobacter sp.]
MRKIRQLKFFGYLLIFFLLPMGLFAQTKLSGTVTDESGGPLPGASIKIKNQSGGVTSDSKGNFTVSLTPNANTIVISYTGYLTRELTVSDFTKPIAVRLATDSRDLDGVVVIGYQNAKRSDLTGSVGSVNAETITKSGAISIDQALQGRIAGVQMTQNTGMPGGGSSIQIRGLSSINSTNEPIYVIDGVVISSGTGSYSTNAFSTINPDDIESIDVLK